jgi:threonine dehydrogenase-like Zn-dependent dehydrogenase
MATTTRAIVQTGVRALELRELPVPDVDAESAILRVEACGICGSDAEQYVGTIPVEYPLIPGHEPLGIIERIGDRAAKRWKTFSKRVTRRARSIQWRRSQGRNNHDAATFDSLRHNARRNVAHGADDF